MDFDTLRVGNSIAVTVATSSIGYTVPTSQVTLDAASGRSNNARYVRVAVEGNTYLAFSPSIAVSVTTANGVLVTTNQPEIFNVAGSPYFAVIGKAATVISVTAVEV